jgi:GNAT superfamily N-acetyltransferase
MTLGMTREPLLAAGIVNADMVDYRLIRQEDLADVVALCAAEPWPSYVKDPQRTWRGLTAPGVNTIVAVEDGRVIGFAQMLGDGEIAAFLSLLLVAADRRRQGIGKQLVEEAYKRCGAERVDLVTDDAAEFYRSFVHHELIGFRIHPAGPDSGRTTARGGSRKGDSHENR